MAICSIITHFQLTYIRLSCHPLRSTKIVRICSYYLRVRRDGNYDTAARSSSSFVGIAGYETEFSTVGGITAPKKIKCRGTDGRQWPQLVKGEWS